MGSDNVVAKLASRVMSVLAIRLRGGKSGQRNHDDGPSDDDIEAMFNAHVSNHLAAVPRAYLALVPPDLADLIREAKAFHEIMDTRGAENETDIAQAEIGFCPRHHVKIRLGPNAGHYLAIPTEMRCDYGNNLEAAVERAQIKRAGAIVVDVFGNSVRREYASAN